MQGVHKVAGILNGVLDVTDGVHATTFTPQALLGRLSLVLIFTESGLLWTGSTHTDKKSLRHNERKKNTFKQDDFKSGALLKPSAA